MSIHIQEKSRYWKCDSCKEFHDAGRPVSHEKADKIAKLEKVFSE